MRVLSILIIFFLIISTSFAQTIQSEFIPSQSLTELKEGDFLEASIKLWPIENVDLTQFNKLEKTVLFNALYLSNIISLGVSPNNADVVEIKAIFIVKSSKIQSVYNFKYNNLDIELHSGALAIRELKDDSKEFYILDQSLNNSRILIYSLGFLSILIIAGIVKRKTIKTFLLGDTASSAKKTKEKYYQVFQKANTREDYESIYEDRDIWMSLLVEKTPAHIEFLKIINQHQFKKDWSSSDLEEVKSSFDTIRRSFDK